MSMTVRRQSAIRASKNAFEIRSYERDSVNMPMYRVHDGEDSLRAQAATWHHR